jgi:hypothetical protein
MQLDNDFPSVPFLLHLLNAPASIINAVNYYLLRSAVDFKQNRCAAAETHGA